MPRLWRITGQFVAYGAFAAVIGYLSAAPSYEHVNPEQAVLRLVISHATAKIGECRKLSPEEYAELPPNMRRATDCPRERHNLHIELLLDEEILYQGVATPTGLWRDGPSNVYRKFTVAPGTHRLLVRFRDSGRDDGFDQERAETIELQPRQNFVIGFRSATGFWFGEG